MTCKCPAGTCETREQEAAKIKSYRCGNKEIRKTYHWAPSTRKIHVRLTGQNRNNDITTKIQRNCQRAKDMAQALILANEKKIAFFWTGTFSENITTYNEAQKRWMAYIKKMKAIYPEITYITTLEIQEERAKKYGHEVYHFHSYMIGLPNKENEIRKRSREIWTKINSKKLDIDEIQKVRSVKHLSSYIRKYITKSSLNHIPKGRKTYFAGGALLERPAVMQYYARETAPRLKATYQRTVLSNYIGLTTYEQGIIKKPSRKW